MKSPPKLSSARRNLTIASLQLCLFVQASLAFAQEPVSFNRDIRPLLTTNCFACHGPDEDKRESDLRLDERESAIESEAIVPGRSDASSLVERVFSDDEDFFMPPPNSGHSLTLRQKQLLKQWINEGAKYDRHWAFVTPESTEPPKSNSDWPRNGIDWFVLQKLNQNGRQPNPEADRYSLVRRVYLDLIGLPPTVEQADEFVNSEDPLAYEKLVDQLLASQHYGERWAQPWLDLARYADTNGYEKDRERSIWPYRDWVIRALNSDMPYDRFSIEQLAGDLLPRAGASQKIATGFHRNTMLNEEGGIDPLEFRYMAMVDRVATTGTIWMGMTTGCAQCHTHKYDPITHTDYFRLMALMNNADEPDLQIPDEKKLAQIRSATDNLQKLLMDLESKFEPVEGEESEAIRRTKRFKIEWEKWIRETTATAVAWNIIRPSAMRTNLPKLEVLEDGSILSTGDTTKRDVFDLTFDLDVGENPIAAIRLEALPDSRLPGFGPGRTYYEGRKGDFFVSEISATLDDQPIEFASASHDFSKPDEKNPKLAADNVFDGDGSTGWQPGKNKSMRLKLVMNLKDPIKKSGTLKIRLLFERHYTVSLGRFRFATTETTDAMANRLEENVEQFLARRSMLDANSFQNLNADWTPPEFEIVKREFLLQTSALDTARKEYETARANLPKLDETMVMLERPANNQRPTHRHHRGEYLNPKEEVTPGIPAMFAKSLSPENQPGNRLELAKWLVSDANSLVARVAANRAWREFFGNGLVKTNGDFGVQAAPPSHPELLDWLALTYRNDFKWSTKKLHRLIVTSSTYRQSPSATEASIESDPENQLLSRGPAFRVPGEVVRDIALTATGALSTKMYGPGVRPPQPESVTNLAFGGTKWIPSKGEDRYRRSIYTFKKRTAAFAAYTVFDGPTGEFCTAKRNRSNTPLQALTVLNDEMYVELCRKMAKQVNARDFESDDEAITWIFRSFLTRPPTTSELRELNKFFSVQLQRLETGELDLKSIGGVDATANQAAFAMLIRIVMNLDETLTKR